MRYLEVLSFLLLFSVFIILNSFTVSALPMPEPGCGDGDCGAYETCSSCPSDCGCPSGYICSSGSCVPLPKTITVCQTYGVCDSTTIQPAINTANSGDTVKIMDNGIYTLSVTQTITISKSITLTSSGTFANPSTMPTISYLGTASNYTDRAIDITGVGGVTISNLKITATQGAYVIYINPGSNNNNIINNYLTETGSTGILIQINNDALWINQAYGNNIIGNNVTVYSSTAGSTKSGIKAEGEGWGNTIIGNTVNMIKTSGSTADGGNGIWLYESPNNILQSNKITVPTNVNDGDGFLISWLCGLPGCTDSKIISYYTQQDVAETNTVNGKPIKYLKGASCNNQVIANSELAMVIAVSCSNLKITNVTTSPYNQGILAVALSNSNVSYNKITTTALRGYGIELLLSSGNEITGNNVTTYASRSGSEGTGIYLHGGVLTNSAGSNNNNIRGNNVTVVSSGGTNRGIGIFRGQSNNIIGNNVRSAGDGIYVVNDYSVNNNIRGNNVTSGGDGIYFLDVSNNNITDTNVTSGGIGIYFDSIAATNNNRVADSRINANGIDIAVSSNSGVYYVINCTFNKMDIHLVTHTQVTGTPKIYNQYYLDVHANDNFGNSADGALVVANDTNAVANGENPTSNFTALTNSSGWIDRQIVTEFMADKYDHESPNYLYFNNYTVNASKLCYGKDSTTVNLTRTLSTTVMLNLTSYICSHYGGYVEFSIEPTFASPSFYVSPSVYGFLPSCEGHTVYFANQSDCPLASRVSNCNVTSSPFFPTDGCVGNSFSLPSASGSYVYYACIDMNCDGDFYDTREQSSLIYTVGYNSLPEFGWMGIVQIMILASAIILLARKVRK